MIRNLLLTLLCVGVGLAMIARPAHEFRDGDQLAPSGNSVNPPVAISFHDFLRQHNLTPADNILVKKVPPANNNISAILGDKLTMCESYECEVDSGCSLTYVSDVPYKDGGWLTSITRGADGNGFYIRGLCEGYDIPVELDMNNNQVKIYGCMLAREAVHDTTTVTHGFDPDFPVRGFTSTKICDTIYSIYFVPETCLLAVSSDVPDESLRGRYVNLDSIQVHKDTLAGDEKYNILDSIYGSVVGDVYEDGSIHFADGYTIILSLETKETIILFNRPTVTSHYFYYWASPIVRNTYLLSPNGVHEYDRKYATTTNSNTSVYSPAPDNDSGDGDNSESPEQLSKAHTDKGTLKKDDCLTELIRPGYSPTGVGSNRPGPIRPPFVPGEVRDFVGYDRPTTYYGGGKGKQNAPSITRSNSGWTEVYMDPDGVKKPTKPLIPTPTAPRDTSHFHPKDPVDPYGTHTNSTTGTTVITTDHEQKPVYLFQAEGDNVVYVFGLYGLGSLQNYMTLEDDGTMDFPCQVITSSSKNVCNYTTNRSNPTNYTSPDGVTPPSDLTPGNKGTWTPDCIKWGKTVLWPIYGGSLYLNNKLYFTNGYVNGGFFGGGMTLNKAGIDTVTRMIDAMLNGNTDITISDVTDTIDLLLRQE